MHEEGLTGLQPGSAVQGHVRGGVRDVGRRRRHVADLVRERVEAVGGQERELGQGPRGERGDADHPSAQERRLDAAAQRHHHAGGLEAGGERQLGSQLVGTAAQQQVGQAQRRRAHPHRNLARARSRWRDLLDGEGGAGLAVPVDPQRPHPYPTARSPKAPAPASSAMRSWS